MRQTGWMIVILYYGLVTLFVLGTFIHWLIE
jgi:hypothetical protein